MENDFESIVDKYSGKLYGYLMKLLSTHADAEDVLQDVFVSFYAKMAFINSEKFSSYLFRTAHNKAINHLKKEKRYAPYNDFKHAQVSEPQPDEENKAKKIRQALKKLKPKELLAVELQIYQNKSYREIADIMETTPNAVDSLLVRAKKKLRIFLQDK